LVIALVIFGPKKLPEIGSALGKGIREFRKSTQAIEDQVKQEFTEVPKETSAKGPSAQEEEEEKEE